ncbi:MAG: hypothetical protein QXD03_05350 [Candidatus Anstonellales archaeon]
MVNNRCSACRNNKIEVIAVYIEGGVITLIEPNGDIGYYRQRGIDKLPKNVIEELVYRGELRQDWYMYDELPVSYKIRYEWRGQGRAEAVFKLNRKERIV